MTDRGISKAVRRYFTAVLPVAVGIGAAAGLLTAFAFWGDSLQPRRFVAWALMITALATIVSGLVYANRISPFKEMLRLSVLESLGKVQAKTIRREILGASPYDPDHLGVARAAAVQLQKTHAPQLLFLPSQVALFLGQSLNAQLEVLRSLNFLLLAVAVVLLAVVAWRFRRMSIFLRQTEPFVETETGHPL